MQLASEMTPSGMMTVFLGPDSNLKTACADARAHCQTLGLEVSECQIANYLYPGCKVIAGNKEVQFFYHFFFILKFPAHLLPTFLQRHSISSRNMPVIMK